MQFENVPPEMLVGTLERLVSKMDEDELVRAYERDLPAMSEGAFACFAEALYDAFRSRGESSEDAVEAAGTTLDAIGRREPSALAALLAYARSNPGLLKETTTLFVEQGADLANALPQTIRDAVAQRLARTP